MAQIARLIAEWQQWLLVQKGHRPSGVERYGEEATRFFRWLEAHNLPLDLAQITRTTIEAWQKSLYFETGNMANASRAQKLACVRSFMTWLVHAGHLSTNPSRGIPSPKALDTLPQKFSSEELDMIFTAPDLTTMTGIRDLAILRLLYAAGPRSAELINLDMKNLKDHGRQFRVTFKKTKGGKDRQFLLSETPSKAVRAWLIVRSGIESKSPALFTSMLKPYNRIGPAGLSDVLHKYAERVGIKSEDAFLHKMRATFATDLYDSGDDCCPRCKAPVRSVDLLTVQIALGHIDPKTTMKYIAISERYLKKLAIPESRFREIERR